MKSNVCKGLLTLVVILLVAEPALADVQGANVMDDALSRFESASSQWSSAIVSAATRLFWSLATISLVWTAGTMILRKADIGEFFAEFFRFIMFIGIFWFFLSNAVTGFNIAGTVVDSLKQLAGEAGGLGSTKLGPSAILDMGFELDEKARESVRGIGLGGWADSLIMQVLGLVMLIIMAIIAVNLLIVQVSAWVLLYGGVFFLGMGGSRWTSDLAIGYYRAILGIAAQLMGMVLIVAIGKDFIDGYYAQISDGLSKHDLSVILVVGVMLLFLVNKIPPMLAGIVTGSAVGSVGAAGSFGAGAMFGAATTASAAAMTVGGLATAGAGKIVAAASMAGQNINAGSDLLARPLGGVQGGIAGAAAKMTRFGADTMANLATGKTKQAPISTPGSPEGLAAKVDNAMGANGAPRFDGNSLTGGVGSGTRMQEEQFSFAEAAMDVMQNTDASVDAKSEVAQFVRKGSRT